MNNGKRFDKSRSGGSYKKPAWNQGGRAQKPSHKAQCADCGNNCMVPFKPNGRKPVRCSDCFRVNGPTEGKSFDGGRSFDRRPTGPSLKDEIASINRKLDRILAHLGE